MIGSGLSTMNHMGSFRFESVQLEPIGIARVREHL